jgi:hypothetical protein
LYSIVHEHIKSCGCVGLEENRQEILNKVMAAEGTILTFIRSDKPSVKNTCGVKGVSWDSRKHRWVARLKCQGVQRHHSSHIKFEDAVAARKQAEEEFYVPILEKYGMKMAGGDKECTKPP